MNPNPVNPVHPVKTSSHTPGPWHIERSGGSYEIWPENKKEAHSAISDRVFRKDDARLIAAAPELLAALQMVHAIVKNSPRQKSELFNTEGWNLICSAIAKAQGEG